VAGRYENNGEEGTPRKFTQEEVKEKTTILNQKICDLPLFL
jgi:hypothetical protein